MLANSLSILADEWQGLRTLPQKLFMLFLFFIGLGIGTSAILVKKTQQKKWWWYAPGFAVCWFLVFDVAVAAWFLVFKIH